MSRYPGIEVDGDLVEGVGVRLWATVDVDGPSGRTRTSFPLVLCIDDARSLHAHLSDALTEYERQAERERRDLLAEEEYADREYDRMKDERLMEGE